MQYNQQIYAWKIVWQNFNIKNEKSDINVNISSISHLPFDMLWYSLESTMVRCKTHWQAEICYKIAVVQNRAPSTTE